MMASSSETTLAPISDERNTTNGDMASYSGSGAGNILLLPGLNIIPNDFFNEEFCKLLVSKPKRAFNKMIEGIPIVHRAVIYRSLKKLKAVLASGADKDDQDYRGRTPLHCACAYAKIEHARVLLQAGANVNALDQYYNTPLHFAVYSGRVECVSLLLQNGADAALTMKNRDNNTPIDLAKLHKRLEVQKLLA